MGTVTSGGPQDTAFRVRECSPSHEQRDSGDHLTVLRQRATSVIEQLFWPLPTTISSNRRLGSTSWSRAGHHQVPRIDPRENIHALTWRGCLTSMRVETVT